MSFFLSISFVASILLLNVVVSTGSNVGVLFMNLGGPGKGEGDIEGFLYNLFADPNIIRLPKCLSVLQKPLAKTIARKRAPTSAIGYNAIGDGGSPIYYYTSRQTELVKEYLLTQGVNVTTYIAMRYWHPYTDEAVVQMQRDGIDQVVVVPLYPQYSISTSTSSLLELQEVLEAPDNHWHPTIQVVPYWYDSPAYTSTVARLVQQELLEAVKELPSSSDLSGARTVHVMFSAHGVPETYVTELGDPYQVHMNACVRLVAATICGSLGSMVLRDNTTNHIDSYFGTCTTGSTNDTVQNVNVQFHLSFQSRVGPVKWLQPYTDVIIKELGDRNVDSLVVVPISFVSEHVETLYEIDVEYRELANESGIVNWRRVPALNLDTGFIQAVGEVVMDVLRGENNTGRCNASADMSCGGDSADKEGTDLLVYSAPVTTLPLAIGAYRESLPVYDTYQRWKRSETTGLVVLSHISGVGLSVQAVSSSVWAVWNWVGARGWWQRLPSVPSSSSVGKNLRVSDDGKKAIFQTASSRIPLLHRGSISATVECEKGETPLTEVPTEQKEEVTVIKTNM